MSLLSVSPIARATFSEQSDIYSSDNEMETTSFDARTNV